MTDETIPQFLTVTPEQAEQAHKQASEAKRHKKESVKKPNIRRDICYGLPDKGERGAVLTTPENLKVILDHFGVVYGYNVVSKGIVLDVPGNESFTDDVNTGALALIEGAAIRSGMSTGRFPQWLTAICSANPFNPFMRMVESKPWDGESRLAALEATVTCRTPEDQAAFSIFLRRWLISVIASQTVAGFWSKGVLTLQGAQSKGKSSWFRRLFVDNVEAFGDGVQLSTRDKDSLLEALSYVCVELGELDGTFRKSDIAALKAFISRKFDKIRRPYAALHSDFPRRTVFCASVNEEKFLADDTGNTRFWVVGVESLDFNHCIDMQQVWAEVLTLVKAGERWYLDDDEQAILDRQTEDFETSDPIEDLLTSRLDPHRKAAIVEYSATALLREIFGISMPTSKQVNRAGKVLREMGFKQRRTKTARFWLIPKPWNENPSYGPGVSPVTE